MLIERLFYTGIMQMGPSRIDPNRQVGVFNPEAIRDLPAQRVAEMQKIAWLAGEWDFENLVPATSASPAYTDIGMCRYALCDNNTWLSAVAPDGRETRMITSTPSATSGSMCSTAAPSACSALQRAGATTNSPSPAS